MPEADKQASGGQPSASADDAGSLLADIMQATKLAPNDDGYDVARKGAAAFISEMLKPTHAKEKADKNAIELMIAEIDKKLSEQLDEILHNAEFQKLESSWRGLKLLVDRTNFRENCRIEIINCSKDALQSDFEDAAELVQSGLYRQCYSNEYGTFGGEPYAMIVGNYDFGPGPKDIALLKSVGAVATMAHAPFVAAAGAEFFGLKDYRELPNLKDLKPIMQSPQYAKWQSFRESEDSRSVGLTAPRFLLRLPYGAKTSPVKSFDYNEKVQGKHNAYLWGNTAFALASKVADSFGKYRWSSNIIGPTSGGTVSDLPLHQYEVMGEIQTKPAVEAMITERREFELSEEGFIALSLRKGSDNACFFAANSCQKPKTFANTTEGKAAELNYRLGTQLPYLFIVNRFAHYIKVMQREQIGSWKEKADLERELNTWISQYVVDMDNASPAVRSKRPLRAAAVTVEDVPGQAGVYKVGVQMRPHFKYMGASFTLSLVGKLDKK
jgi:type VI secretion system protein ImpC